MSFPTEPSAGDPRGTLEISASGDTHALHIQACFPIDTTPGASSPYGSSLRFSYLVHDFPRAQFMTDLAQAIKTLHEQDSRAFQREGKAFQDFASLSAALAPLANLGSSLFVKLFGIGLNQASSEYTLKYGGGPQDVPYYGAALRHWLASSAPISLSADFDYLPWNIIYPANPRSPISATNFWCFSKPVELRMPYVSDYWRMRRDWRLVVGVEAQDDKLRPGQLLHQDNKHPFVLAGSRVEQILPPDGPSALFQKLCNADVLYHYGHASGSARGLSFARIQLNHLNLDAMELERDLKLGTFQIPIRDQQSLMAFLNACSTGVSSELNDSLCDALRRQAAGRFCFVTTIGQVPVWGAAQFATNFFYLYLGASDRAGQTLGEAIMGARHAMLREYISPVGMFYTAIGKLSTTIGAM